MSTLALKEQVSNLYFVFQPIIRTMCATYQKIYSYEVLLRSKEDGRFPVDLFTDLITDESKNKILLDEYVKMVYDFMESHPHSELSINLHHQQLSHESTWGFLKKIQNYSQRITIEFTEFPPDSYVRNNFSTRAWMRDINELGFKIALDDVDSGLNSLQFVMDHIDLLHTIKFSMLPFRKMDRSTMLHFIEGWIKISTRYGIGFVVEAVEDRDTAKQLSKMGAIYQQGYYWGRGMVL